MLPTHELLCPHSSGTHPPSRRSSRTQRLWWPSLHSEEGTPVPDTKGEASQWMAHSGEGERLPHASLGPRSPLGPSRGQRVCSSPRVPESLCEELKSRQSPATGPPCRALAVKSSGSGPGLWGGGQCLPPRGHLVPGGVGTGILWVQNRAAAKHPQVGYPAPRRQVGELVGRVLCPLSLAGCLQLP